MTRPPTRAPGPSPSPSLNHLDAGELLASVPSTGCLALFGCPMLCLGCPCSCSRARCRLPRSALRSPSSAARPRRWRLALRSLYCPPTRPSSRRQHPESWTVRPCPRRADVAATRTGALLHDEFDNRRDRAEQRPPSVIEPNAPPVVDERGARDLELRCRETLQLRGAWHASNLELRRRKEQRERRARLRTAFIRPAC